jgi:hypothetical protein
MTLLKSARSLGPIAALLVLTAACNVEQPNGLSGVGSTTTSTHAVGSTGSGATTTSSGSGGMGGSGGTPQQAAFSIMIDNTTPTVDLADNVILGITIKPNGVTGDVALSVDSLAAGITPQFGDPSLTLDGSTTASTTLTLTTESSTAPGDVTFKVYGTQSGAEKAASATLTVNAAITITIPMGVNGLQGTSANPYKMAFGPYPIMITAPPGISAGKPVAVRFYNADGVAHEIHGSNPNEGFPHDNGSFPANSMDPMVREVNKAGTYDFYLHDQGGPFTVGRVVIQ